MNQSNQVTSILGIWNSINKFEMLNWVCNAFRGNFNITGGSPGFTYFRLHLDAIILHVVNNRGYREAAVEVAKFVVSESFDNPMSVDCIVEGIKNINLMLSCHLTWS